MRLVMPALVAEAMAGSVARINVSPDLRTSSPVPRLAEGQCWSSPDFATGSAGASVKAVSVPAFGISSHRACQWVEPATACRQLNLREVRSWQGTGSVGPCPSWPWSRWPGLRPWPYWTKCRLTTGCCKSRCTRACSTRIATTSSISRKTTKATRSGVIRSSTYLTAIHKACTRPRPRRCFRGSARFRKPSWSALRTRETRAGNVTTRHPECCRTPRRATAPRARRMCSLASCGGNSYPPSTGNSRGGLFAVYALTADSKLFTAFHAHSPALWRDDGAMLETLESFLRANPALESNLFMSLGARENPKMTKAFNGAVAILKLNEPQALQWRAVLTEGATHDDNAERSTPLALQWTAIQQRLDVVGLGFEVLAGDPVPAGVLGAIQGAVRRLQPFA